LSEIRLFGFDEFFENSLLSNFQAQVFRNPINIYFDTKPDKEFAGRDCLVLLEPPTVNPELYDKRFLNKFDLVIFLSPWRAELYQSRHWSFQPIARPNLPMSYAADRRLRIAIINDHKFGACESSRYGFRRKVIKLAQFHDLPLDLYGTNWEMSRTIELRKRLSILRRTTSTSLKLDLQECFGDLFHKYSSFRGHAEDKIQTLVNYKYNLIIENDIDSLTEKLFDAVFAGAIPLFVGPNLGRFTKLNGLVIQLPDNPKDAIMEIEELIHKDHSELEFRIAEFVKDSSSMEFLSVDAVSSQIYEHIYRFELAS